MKHLISPCRLDRQGGPNLKDASRPAGREARPAATRRVPGVRGGPGSSGPDGSVSSGRHQAGGGRRGGGAMGFPPGGTAADAVGSGAVADWPGGGGGGGGGAGVGGGGGGGGAGEGGAGGGGPAGGVGPALVEGPAVVDDSASAAPPARVRPAVVRPSTGDARVDDAVARLDDL